MQRTPVFASGNGWYSFANRLDERLDVFERAAREYAMAEVEDVAGATGREPEHASRPADHALGGAGRDSPGHDALDTHGVADPCPNLIHVYAADRRDRL